MATTVQLPEADLTHKVETLFMVEGITHGQPQAYADVQDIVRVHMFSYDWRGENPKPMTYDSKFNDALIDRVIAVAGFSHVPRSLPNEINAYFRGWIDYAKIVAPGVVEIRRVMPYDD